MDAFDADALIYSAAPAHPLGAPVRRLLEMEPRGIGSVALLPELLIKPMRLGLLEELDALIEVIGLLELLAVDEHTAELAVVLGSRYGLRALDALHLATAVGAGADRFITNNTRDFSDRITEIDIVAPRDLPAGP